MTVAEPRRHEVARSRHEGIHLKSILRAFFVFFVTSWLLIESAPAAEVIPPAPANHFNDYANVISPATVQSLNSKLDEFERQTSNQIVVAIFPKMQSDSSIEDYTVRVFQAWKVGLKSKNNGAVLFVFVQDRKMFINTGYGLEGALPDAICKQIIEQEIKPNFQQNNFDAGLTAGVNAMMAAARGEYQGTGGTVRDNQRGPGSPLGEIGKGTGGLCWIVAIFVIIILVRGNRSTIYGHRGRRNDWFWGPGYYGGYQSGWGSGSSSGSWDSGSSGGGGSYSGGGGSTGGGGAGGSW